jgi:hypothetical protein
MTRGGRRARFGSPHSLPGELDHERTWVAVDFTKTRPEPPFDGDDGLTAAVGKLPRRAFCCGLDVRGSFIVRLADLNGYLGRLHDDLRHPQSKSRVSSWSSCEIPTAATAATMFLDGAELADGDVSEYVIDAGRGHIYSDWIESRDGVVESASPAAAARVLRQPARTPVHRRRARRLARRGRLRGPLMSNHVEPQTKTVVISWVEESRKRWCGFRWTSTPRAGSRRRAGRVEQRRLSRAGTQPDRGGRCRRGGPGGGVLRPAPLRRSGQLMRLMSGVGDE